MSSAADTRVLLEEAKPCLEALAHGLSLSSLAERQRCRSLACRCHERMHALEDQGETSDELRQLAWAGAQLFAQLLDSSGEEPPWVAVCHEQCCRLGLIRLHQLLTDPLRELSGEELAELRGQAQVLIERLKALPAPPAAWLLRMEETLQQRQPGASGSDGPLIVVVGNCQSFPLHLGLCQALPHARHHLARPVHMATADDVAQLHGLLPAADVLVMHRVQPGYRDGLGVDMDTLSALLPSGAKRLVLPNLHYEGHHPWIGYAADPDGELNRLEAEAPLGPYHDFLAMEAAQRGLEAADLLALPLTVPVAEALQAWHAASLEQLRQREADCSITLSDWIERHHREARLFHTFNHPSNRTLEALLGRLVAAIDPQWSAAAATDLGARESLGGSSHSIHPWVRQALELGSWASAPGQRGHDQPWTLEEETSASIDFYRRHPWIHAAQANRPKARLAGELLDGAAGGPAWVPAASETTNPANAAWLTVLHPQQGFTAQPSPPPLAEPPAQLSWAFPLHLHRLGVKVLADARVLPVGVVHEGCWYADCVQYLPQRWTELGWLQTLSGYRLTPAGDAPSVALRDGEPDHDEVALAGSWCVLNDIVGRRNLAHFFSDLLPQLAAIRRLHQQQPDLGVIASTGYLPNVERLLRLLLPGVAIWRRPEGAPREVPRVRVERLLLQPVAFNGGVGFHPRFEREWWLALSDLEDGLTVLRQAFEAEGAASSMGLRDHWLCLHRDLRAPTEAPQGRFFSNHAELLERLASAGVLVVDPGHHDIGALYPLLRGARGFVGIHGAGLANSFLAPAGARVIEIRPQGGTWGMLELLGRATGKAWQVSRAAADPADPASSVVDIEAVIEAIQALG